MTCPPSEPVITIYSDVCLLSEYLSQKWLFHCAAAAAARFTNTVGRNRPPPHNARFVITVNTLCTANCIN